ncbi:MAG: nucleotidyltransferase domain-containing protein [Candidatus Omnitrophota bacterium]
MEPRIPIDMGKIKAFCEKWRVTELSLFGSVLRSDFGPESDVDVLVKINKNAPWDTIDFVYMIDDLEKIFGRKVDLLEAEGIRNPFRRYEIAKTRKIIYAA